ncbi:MAG TPA: tetratricopeptide repeat protein, partial [Tahibacter sp.]|uniref:tetratricopeptide repeat protein n=1 Tax=Tahibacter sp. TaxID=2056211 RepID=UPI002C6CBCC2
LWEAKIRALQGSGDNPGSLRSTEMALKQLAKRADYKPERVDWIRLQRASGLYAAGTHLDYQREAGILLNDMRNGGRTHDALYIETLRQTARSHSVYSEFAAALPLYEEAVALQISLYGENHKTMPALLGGLASVYDGLKRLDEGRELYRRAIESSERIFGKTHRTTASINYYAADQQYFSYRNLTEAERLVRRAIAANPPEARGNAAIFHHRLAELLVLQEKLFEADYHASLAYDIAISTYAFGELIHITPVNSAYIALRRYNLPAASRLLTGSLIGTVRQFKLYYYVRMSIEADALGAFFGWNRESDGSTIVPPMRR